MFGIYDVILFFSIAILIAVGLVTTDAGAKGASIVEQYCTGDVLAVQNTTLGQFM